jgi:hypothetical protein
VASSVGEKGQSGGKSQTSGKVSTSSLQANAQTAIAAAISAMARQRLPTEGEDWTGESENARCRDRAEVAGVIGAYKIGVEEERTSGDDTAGERRERAAGGVGVTNFGSGELLAID